MILVIGPPTATGIEERHLDRRLRERGRSQQRHARTRRTRSSIPLTTCFSSSIGQCDSGDQRCRRLMRLDRAHACRRHRNSAARRRPSESRSRRRDASPTLPGTRTASGCASDRGNRRASRRRDTRRSPRRRERRARSASCMCSGRTPSVPPAKRACSTTGAFGAGDHGAAAAAPRAAAGSSAACR